MERTEKVRGWLGQDVPGGLLGGAEPVLNPPRETSSTLACVGLRKGWCKFCFSPSHHL